MQSIRPILFSGPMVRALLDGRKTQTRRLIKADVGPPPDMLNMEHAARHIAPYLDAYCGGPRTELNPRGMTSKWCWWTRDDRPCLPLFDVRYKPGDLLWVRETWGLDCFDDGQSRSWKRPVYRADDGDAPMDNGKPTPWKPSIFMPRGRSRLTLEITDVRVQRLHEISETDAVAEGVSKIRDNCYAIKGFDYDLSGLGHNSPIIPFAKLWDHINGPGNQINGEWVSAWEQNPWTVALTFNVHKQNIDAFLQEREAA
jgi:hypothetical protein